MDTIEKIPFDDGFLYVAGSTEFSERSIVPMIAEAVRPFGTLVMYGKENTGPAQAGQFIELYSTDENWLANVRSTCRECAAIIFVPSDSPSLNIELSHILSSSFLTKTVFILPPVLYTFEIENETLLKKYWNRELSDIMESLNCKLPQYPKEGIIFMMNENKEPSYSAPILTDSLPKIEDSLPYHFATIFSLIPRSTRGNSSEFTYKIVKSSFKKSAFGLIRKCGLALISAIAWLTIYVGKYLIIILLCMIVIVPFLVFINEIAGTGVAVFVLFVLMLILSSILGNGRNDD